ACGTYSAANVFVAFRDHDRALVIFGEQVGRAAHGRTLAAVHGKDEGMLLYLGLTRFTKIDEAVAQWRAGEVQALVLPTDLWEAQKAQFTGARVELESEPAPSKNSRYAFITRGS